MAEFCHYVPLPLKHPKMNSPASLCQARPVSEYATQKYCSSEKQKSTAQHSWSPFSSRHLSCVCAWPGGPSTAPPALLPSSVWEGCWGCFQLTYQPPALQTDRETGGHRVSQCAPILKDCLRTSCTAEHRLFLWCIRVCHFCQLPSVFGPVFGCHH